ncbi:hypothetical protein OPT61_g4806 [Boeremia exigua]|uniref:Uncharacterized protein n=1 Tax=Boeremia exigua TaxID=749465 RepID=A0ACC2ICQ1_9PLEO|nr:hypothetical protein OPT61_g4806 [Boeremia exigua]
MPDPHQHDRLTNSCTSPHLTPEPDQTRTAASPAHQHPIQPPPHSLCVHREATTTASSRTNPVQFSTHLWPCVEVTEAPGLDWTGRSGVGQSRAEQSRAEQSRAEQSSRAARDRALRPHISYTRTPQTKPTPQTDPSTAPYPWSPNIVDIQALRIGQFVIVVAPGEATTMSGRRWREAVFNAAKSSLVPQITNPLVVLAGPANTYAHYIATEEEYSVQRYEGASTLFGPHTLAAFINATLTHLPYLADSPPGAVPAGPTPPDNRARSISLITGVVYDSAGIGTSFGAIKTAPKASYTIGETVRVVFVGANPRNNLRLEGSYTSIERRSDAGVWEQVRGDRDWDVVFEWKRVNGLTGTSEVGVSWDTGLVPRRLGGGRIG